MLTFCRRILQESTLIQELKHGSQQAFRELVRQHKDRVYNTCLGFLRQREDAEDTAQEVFIEVWKSIQEFDNKSMLSTWLYRIAVTKSLELIRFRKAEKRKSFFESMRATENDPDQFEGDGLYEHPGAALENKERMKVLFEAIDHLSENQKVAFTLHKVEGLRYKEIAEVMETSISAVESLMHRAKTNLQDLLYEFYTSEEQA